MRHLLSITLLCFSLLSPKAEAVSVMVNEFWNGSGSQGPGTKMARDEYIEFVITQTTTAAELASLTFGDSNDSTTALQGVFQFDLTTLNNVLAGSSVSAFQAGTIIVVKGINLGPQNLTYNPLANNLTNTDAWSIELVAGQGAKDAPETRINGNISIGNNGEVVWISSTTPTRNNDTSGFIDAIGYDNNPGTIANAVRSQFGNDNILSTTVTSGRSISNLGAGGTELLSVSTTGTMGTANGGLNTAWIVGGLRTTSALTLAPEPGRVGLIIGGTLLFALRRRRTLPAARFNV